MSIPIYKNLFWSRRFCFNYRELINWPDCNTLLRVLSSSETQGLLAGTMQLIFLGEHLLQELKSPWELILTEPVPEVVEFRPADWAEKYFSAQSAMRSSRVTLSPSYTKLISSAIDLVAWPVQREDCCGEFQKKRYSIKPRKSQGLTWGLGTDTLPSIFLADLLSIECISIVIFLGLISTLLFLIAGK